jgi:hypothetical protein
MWEQEFTANCLASGDLATHCDRELETVNIILMQLFSRTRFFKKAVIQLKQDNQQQEEFQKFVCLLHK